tara:strand:+ start:274 stop:1542 length:1269 start_codon:yes stop_codon:yes gene_type:complete
MNIEIKSTLDELFILQRHGVKVGLTHTKKLLNAIGNPDKKLKFIHVAGTNGKGSISISLYNILKQVGLKVGIYTSPHLINFNERIRVDGIPISNISIVKFMNKYIEDIKNIESTFFETTTVMALDYFYHKKVDIAIIETGLGGRLDSTNVINPELTIIGSISMDHMEILGDSITDIAYEKAGIIKKKCPLVYKNQSKEVDRVIIGKANELNSDIVFVDNESISNKSISNKRTRFKYKFKEYSTPLLGEHQIENTAIAIEAANYLFPRISYNIIVDGISKIKWPGRLEEIKHNKLYYDVAHNASGINKTIVSLKKMYLNNKINGLLCLKSNKDLNSICREIKGKFEMLIITSDKVGLLEDPSSISNVFIKNNIDHIVVNSIGEGIKVLLSPINNNKIGLIFGSHFIASEIYSFMGINFDNGVI